MTPTADHSKATQPKAVQPKADKNKGPAKQAGKRQGLRSTTGQTLGTGEDAGSESPYLEALRTGHLTNRFGEPTCL
jgi:hypothetical protein